MRLVWAAANVGGGVLSEGMENIGAVAVTAIVRDDLSQEDFDVEFDAMVQKWAAERWAAEHGEYDEAQDCLDALLEARAIKASAEAREQQCLARLEAIALASADHSNSAHSNSAQPDAGSSAREIAWRSMAAEIAVATRQADRTVQSMMGQAAALVHDLPAVLEALGCGRIAFGHARVILEHAMGIESDALEEYQRITLDRAETTTPGKLAATAKIAADRLRTESFEERHARAREARSVSIRDLDNGMSELLHLLPTPFAAAIFDRLTRQAKAVSATGDPRTRDQLRSDLATDLLLTGEPSSDADAPHTAAHGIRAEVSIVIPALTLLGRGNEPATLAGRGPIDLDTACQLAGMTTELVRVLTHPVTGMVIAADTYRPTASLRRYLAARDRHCQFPTCNRDARWCDIDHTFAWEEGGKTTPDNLAHLCRGHHTLKHHGGWKVRQTTPGVLEWTSPLGKVVATDSIVEASPPGPRFEHQPPF
jgi:hypothetical protein